MISIREKSIREDNVIAKIGAKAFSVLIVLEAHRSKDDRSWPSIKKIMKNTGIGRDAVTKSIKTLIENGLICKELKRESGRIKGMEYSHHCPYISKFYPSTESQSLENRSTENKSLEIKARKTDQLKVSSQINILEENKNTKENKNNTPDSGESTVSAKELKKEKVDAIYSFDQFWNDYGKKNDKKKCQKKYYSLALKDIKRIKETLPNYIKATPEVQYRKNPYTYLNAETWNDEQYQIQAKRTADPDKPVYRMRKREAPKPTPPPPTAEEWAMIEAHAKKLGYGSKLEKESKEDKDKQTSQRPKSGLARANERLREARQAARERAFEGWVA